MWIKTENEATTALAPKGVDWDDRAQFNDQGVAQVKSDVGQKLINQFDCVREKDAGKEDTEDDDSSHSDN